MLGRVASNVKDAALSRALRRMLNERFAEYGRVQDCVIESRERRVTLVATLNGEREPMTAAIERFEIQRENGRAEIVLQRFTCSRAWIATLLNRLFAGKRYELPSTVAALL